MARQILPPTALDKKPLTFLSVLLSIGNEGAVAKPSKLMANVADPSVNAEADDASAAKPAGKKKKLIIIGGAVLLLAAVGGAGYFFMAKGGGEDHAEGEAAVVEKPPIFVDLPEMMVNLAVPADRPQYLKLKIALEISDERLAEKINPMMPRVLDAFQVHLREMRPADLDGSAGLYRLKEELLRRINAAVYPGRVEAILFKEVLVQ